MKFYVVLFLTIINMLYPETVSLFFTHVKFASRHMCLFVDNRSREEVDEGGKNGLIPYHLKQKQNNNNRCYGLIPEHLIIQMQFCVLTTKMKANPYDIHVQEYVYR